MVARTHGRVSMLGLFVQWLYCLQTVWRPVSVSGRTTSSNGQTVVNKSVQRLATGWTVRSSGLVKCKRQFFLHKEKSTPVPGHTQTPIRRVPVYLTLVKQPGQEGDHSPPSSADVKNEWRYTSAPRVRFHGLDRDNFTFFIPVRYETCFVIPPADAKLRAEM